MTIEEIEVEILRASGNHRSLHITLGSGFLDLNAEFVLQAVEQIKRAMTLIRYGVDSPEQHRCESLLLSMLDDAHFHGYTGSHVETETKGYPANPGEPEEDLSRSGEGVNGRRSG